MATPYAGTAEIIRYTKTLKGRASSSPFHSALGSFEFLVSSETLKGGKNDYSNHNRGNDLGDFNRNWDLPFRRGFMSYFYYEAEGRVRAISSSFWALVDFCHPRLIKWSETLPGTPSGQDAETRPEPRQTIRPKKFKARADLLTAAHWRG